MFSSYYVLTVKLSSNEVLGICHLRNAERFGESLILQSLVELLNETDTPQILAHFRCFVLSLFIKARPGMLTLI